MKKVLAIVVAAMMVLAMFAGCEDASGRGDALRIGLTGPFTGDNAVYGQAVKWGMEIAVEEINAKGGLQIEFKAEDDESDNEKALSAFSTLMDWDMQIFAGAVTTGPSLAIAPKAVENNMFMMTPSASNEDVAKGNTGVYQMCFTDPNQGAVSAILIDNQKLGTKIGVLYDSSTDYSVGIYNSFMAEATARNMNVAVKTSFDSNAADMKTQLQQCKDAGCDLVFIPIYAVQAVTILQNADDMDYHPTFLGCDGMDGILGVENFNTQLAEGLIMMTPFDANASDEATKSFVEKYKAKSGGEVPNQFAADGYDVIYAIYAGCVAKGITGKTSNADTNKLLQEYFASATFNGLTGSDMTWDANGFVSKEPAAVVVKDGKYVSMDGQ